MGTAHRVGRIRTEVLDAWRSRDLEEFREMAWVSVPEYIQKQDHDSLHERHPTEALLDPRSSSLKRATCQGGPRPGQPARRQQARGEMRVSGAVVGPVQSPHR